MSLGGKAIIAVSAQILAKVNSAAAWHGTCYMQGVLTNDGPRRRTRVRPGIEVSRHEMGVAIENSKVLLSASRDSWECGAKIG